MFPTLCMSLDPDLRVIGTSAIGLSTRMISPKEISLAATPCLPTVTSYSIRKGSPWTVVTSWLVGLNKNSCSWSPGTWRKYTSTQSLVQNDDLGSSLNDVTVLGWGRGQGFCCHSNKKRDDKVGVSKNVRNCVTLFMDDFFSVSPTQPVNKPRSNCQLVCHKLYAVCH